VEMIKEWKPTPKPAWIACIPSLKSRLVPDFAARLAKAMNIPFVPCIKKVRNNSPQLEMHNSFHKAKNLDGVFEVDRSMMPPARVCLLMMWSIRAGRSRWQRRYCDVPAARRYFPWRWR